MISTLLLAAAMVPCEEAARLAAPFELNASPMNASLVNVQELLASAGKKTPAIAEAANGAGKVDDLLPLLRSDDHELRWAAAIALRMPLYKATDAEKTKAVAALLAAMRREDHDLDPARDIQNFPPRSPQLDFQLDAAWTLLVTGPAALAPMLAALEGPGSIVYHHVLASIVGRSGNVPAVLEALARTKDLTVQRRLAKAVALTGIYGGMDLRAAADAARDPVVRCLLEGPLHAVYAPPPPKPPR